MLITFSGLDGAGKSTLTQALKAELERNGMRVVIVHMNKDVGLYAYIRNLRDSILGAVRPEAHGSVQPASPPEPSGRSANRPNRLKAAWREARRRIIWNKSLRKLVDLGDLALFRMYQLYAEGVRGRVLIMDRYFYDRLADQADGQRWRYLRWFARTIPTPDLAIFVEVSAEEAFRRKGEYSVEAMTQRLANYREIFSWVPGSVTLPNDDLESTVQRLDKIVRARIQLRARKRAMARG